MQKNTTKIRLITQFTFGTAKAIATFEGNKIVAFEPESGTMRNLQTLTVLPENFVDYAQQFNQENSFGLGGKSNVNS